MKKSKEKLNRFVAKINPKKVLTSEKKKQLKGGGFASIPLGRN